MKKLLNISILLITAVIGTNSQDSSAKEFVLFKLPYESNSLEPVISKQTVELHHGKHVQAYINNLNKLIKGTPFENASLEDIVKYSDGGLFNNAAQVWNHEFYFNTFSPKGGGEPSGALADAINKQFGSFENFKKEFNAASVGLFGSGWSWLAKDKSGKLVILKESNAGNPLKAGLTALIGFDVWEHSYYIDYQNRRADHVEALWKIIDWKVVEKRFGEK
ncbi:MAG: superoxide dismutase [Tannerella sp.]|jgi:Fe-Mn family superoxide dismutase|nr:superoxide dismutase [Tannerella sp.]